MPGFGQHLAHPAAADEYVEKTFQSPGERCQFGELLHESWTYKRSLSDKVSTPEIDQIYEAAMGAGATGGKILGAGGGGFLLLFVKPELQARVKERLKHLIHVPFGFETSGSRVIVYQPNGLT